MINPPDEIALNFRILVLYDDVAAGRRATRCLNRVLSDNGLDRDCLTLWRLDLLDLIEMVDREAEQFCWDLIVLSLRGDRKLSRETQNWLMRWVAARDGAECVLAVIFDSEQDRDSHVVETLFKLEETMAQGPTKLFVGFIPAIRMNGENSPGMLAIPARFSLDAWGSSDADRGWGINE